MEKKQTLIESPVVVSGLTLVPVSQVKVWAWQDRSSLSFMGLKRPLYVIVTAADSPMLAFNINGEPISLEMLSDIFPELQKALHRTEALAVTIAIFLQAVLLDYRPQFSGRTSHPEDPARG